MGAPSCTVFVKPPVQQGNAPLVPSIPVPNANNIVQVLSAIRNYLITQGNNNNSGNGSNPGTVVGGVKVSDPKKQSSFVQVQQTVKPVKVYDPNDPSMQTYVTVQQIVNLQMTNQATGETWNWVAPGNTPG
jgi:hypothetical protein